MQDTTINVNYFNKINSFNKAYLLGFIAADGAVVSNKGYTTKTLTITIHHKDEAVLILLKEELKSSLPIKIIDCKSKSLSSYKLEVNHRRFNTSKKEIINALKSYGIGENKSLIMSNILINIPEKFRKAFIIGYFDGDGCFVDSQITRTRLYKKQDNITSTYTGKKWNTCIAIKGTKELLQGIVDELEIEKYSIKKIQDQKIHTLLITSNEGILKFYDCYKHCRFCLQRKKIKFARKILQVQTISSS